MKKTLVFLAFLVALAAGCSRTNEMKPGPWLGVILPDSTDLSMAVPFNMNLTTDDSGKMVMTVTNAGEEIPIREITRRGDSIFMKFPVFTSEIEAVLRHDSLIGAYYPKGREAGTAYGFYAVAGVKDRFPWATASFDYDITGRWKIIENPGTPDSAIMVGIFKQDSNRVTGTILNTTGDYRYLEGKVSANEVFLSAVDGAHTLIFKAEVGSMGTLENGKFLGSPKWKSVWRAVPDSTITLPKADELVWVRKDADPFTFAFPAINGDTVKYPGPLFDGKVVIVQVMGSWCPNCLDESRFYRDFYKKYKGKVEIVGLCFEDPTFETSAKKMQRFRDQIGIEYPLLYAGPRSRENRAKVLHMLDGQVAYPTTLFIDKKGKIRKVETGFSGPGTGIYYNKFVNETNAFVQSLLSE